MTIPDCDHVVCLGHAKQIEYDASSHRSMLVTSWISQSSAIQRAGRTGRTRPGNVYRLYGKHLFDAKMVPHATSEIHRQPLDAVILQLHSMMASDDSVAALLAETLEPPDETYVTRSFESLHRSGFQAMKFPLST